ncbi:MAG: hypothetical protein ABIA78_04185 [archaeon]
MTKEEEDTEEESELEEELESDNLEEIAENIEEESPEIDDDIPIQFISTRTTAPILEHIASEQESGAKFFFTPGMNREIRGNDNQPLYSGEAGDQDKPKYENSYAESAHLERVDFTQVGRDVGNPALQETRRMHSNMATPDSQMQEKKYEAERIDMQKVGRGDPFKTPKINLERKKSDYFIK